MLTSWALSIPPQRSSLDPCPPWAESSFHLQIFSNLYKYEFSQGKYKYVQTCLLLTAARARRALRRSMLLQFYASEFLNLGAFDWCWLWGVFDWICKNFLDSNMGRIRSIAYIYYWVWIWIIILPRGAALIRLINSDAISGVLALFDKRVTQRSIPRDKANFSWHTAEGGIVWLPKF